MPRSRRADSEWAPRSPAWRSRHGRTARASITGPHLPALNSRIDAFDLTVAATADYLKSIWPNELADVSFHVANAPLDAAEGDEVERWFVDARHRQIVLYRIPIQRLARLHRNDEMHKRMYVESCVFRAVADLLGKDPWDLAPERFRHF